MWKRLFNAVFVLTAIPCLAKGEDESAGRKDILPAPIRGPGIQSAPPDSTFNEAAALPYGDPLEVSGPSVSFGDLNWGCAPPNCFWLRADYLLWWIKDAQAPALITTGLPGVNTLPGVLGQPGTSVLFGGSDINNDSRNGGRFGGGVWLDHCQSIGLEGSYFFLANRSVRFDDRSDLIARPFFDVISGIQNAQLVAFPGIANGEIHLNYFNRFQGADLNIFCVPYCTPCCDPCAGQGCADGDMHRWNNCSAYFGCNYYVSPLVGIRYLQLDEGLSITETTRVNTSLPAVRPLFGGSVITTIDEIETRNYFYGAQVGGQAEICRGGAFINVRGKIAAGLTHEVVDIRGSTRITPLGGATAVTPAGFLALGSNSGHFSRSRFAVVPEIGANVGYQITRNLRASVGYTFLYWSSVARAEDQVDVGLSGTEIPTDARFNPQAGPARPAVPFRDTDFWAHGVNFGLELRY